MESPVEGDSRDDGRSFPSGRGDWVYPRRMASPRDHDACCERVPVPSVGMKNLPAWIPELLVSTLDNLSSGCSML